MSYVLDALEKSERERQQNHPANLLSIHTAEPSFGDNHRGKKLFLISGFIFLLLFLTVGLLTITLFKKQETMVQSKPVAVTPPTQRRIIINPIVATVLSQKEYHLEFSDESMNIIAEKKKIRFTTPAEPNPNDETAETTSDTIFLRDLPAELQEEIPELKFSGHTFSTAPARRLIIVNNQILREGDSIDAVTTLKEITWKGAIIDFRGILFRIENQ